MSSLANPSEDITVRVYTLHCTRLYVLTHEKPGDIVAVSHGAYGRREGLVVGAHIDHAVRLSSSSYYKLLTPL
jgi:hypothetical protein